MRSQVKKNKYTAVFLPAVQEKKTSAAAAVPAHSATITDSGVPVSQYCFSKSSSSNNDRITASGYTEDMAKNYGRIWKKTHSTTSAEQSGSGTGQDDSHIFSAIFSCVGQGIGSIFTSTRPTMCAAEQKHSIQINAA